MTYDALVRSHYDKVAEQDGDAATSTMADEIVRATETKTIIRFAEQRELLRRQDESDAPLVVADVGCGNGYTLSRLSSRDGMRLYGVEYNDKLRDIAAKRGGFSVLPGDIRDRSTISIKPGTIDALICQRVLINLLDIKDQKRALETCLDMVRPGGAMLFIEVFQSGLDRLNEARAEWGLSPIPPAHHNLPLPDNFFDGRNLVPIPNNRHKLSSHFFVTRVLHELTLRASGQKEFTRNSHFVRFLSAALPPVGEYAPLQFVALHKLP